MVSESDYLKIAESFKSIDIAEIDLEGKVRDFETMSGLSACARRRRMIYIFKDGTTNSAILSGIKAFSDLVTPDKVKLYGRLSDKLDRVLNSDEENVEYLDIVQFDDIADMMIGNIDDFEKHKITDELVKLAKTTF